MLWGKFPAPLHGSLSLVIALQFKEHLYSPGLVRWHHQFPVQVQVLCQQAVTAQHRASSVPAQFHMCETPLCSKNSEPP